MVAVQVMFFDSDDYQVNCDVIPCDTLETAQEVVKKIYEEIKEDYAFDTKKEEKEWEKECVRKRKDGSILIEGGDCGYAEVTIIDKEPLTSKSLSSFKPETHCFY